MISDWVVSQPQHAEDTVGLPYCVSHSSKFLLHTICTHMPLLQSVYRSLSNELVVLGVGHAETTLDETTQRRSWRWGDETG